MKKLDEIEYIVIDVDGTLTDSGIYYDNYGNEVKKFCVRDAAGFFAAHYVGIKILVLTGRECLAVSRRMEEMQVDFLFQNVKDKKSFLGRFLREHNISKQQLAYIGDDLNDLPAMKYVGFVGCPADSCEEVIKYADYVSNCCGGKGVVRDVISHILKERGQWEKAISKIYGLN